ncbi:P-loop ATPase, Sll1717 family [Streptomyces collinus]|uniref:P-loop ATPase, Sll1717 family n=1 Tax=Streptomyces collinus TaxID=42684 RepID=UPI0036897125
MVDEPMLARLHFGREDAERDVTDGHGLLLRGGFLPTAAYKAAVLGRKMLIIGRKGAGKSAICMQLMAVGDGDAGKVLVTPDETAGEEIRRFELQGLQGDSAKALIWRYVFAVHAARYLVAHAKDVHGRRTDSVKVLLKFLKQNGELAGDRLGDRLAQGAKGLQTSLSLEAFGVKAGIDFSQAPSEGARAVRQLEVVERGVERGFTELGCGDTHEPLLLLVDQLEQVWSAEPDSNSMVIGLLLAAKHAAGRYGRAARILLFLRADIYDSLAFGEGDKFHGDELRITWTREALGDLALARARASAGQQLTAGRLWQDVFPRTVGGEETPTYIFSRCLPRPRDAIQFLNLCQETAYLKHDRDRITEADVIEAEAQFSAWKLKDLSLEYLVAHPFLKVLFPLFQNQGYVVSRAALDVRFTAAVDSLRGLFPAYADALTLAGVIDVLHSVGFLGVRRGHDVVFAWDDDLLVQPHETEFHIHPCFRTALGATNAIDLRRYEPAVVRDRLVQGTVFNNTFALRSITNRDERLLGELARSCQSVLSQVGRAVALTPGARDEITREIGRVHTETVVSARLPVDADERLLSASHYFTSLSAQLTASGLVDGAQDVAHRLEEEARRLRRLAGGSYGSSGDSGGL